MDKFDLAIIGGGPGGYVAAIRGSQLGKKVCIIDQYKLGGICLNWGCIPTKTLLKNAEVYETIKNSHKYGISVGDIKVDFKKNVKRSRDVSNRLSKGIEFLMKKNKVIHKVARARFISTRKIELTANRNIEIIEAEKIIIATGAKAKTLPSLELDGKQIISSREAMLLVSPPKDIIIIGSGAIGCEFAYYFNQFGTNVTIIEKMDSILPNEDSEVSKELDKNFKKSGITIETGVNIRSVEKLKTKVRIQIQKKSKKITYETQTVLVAVGVKGNVENIGLDRAGVLVKNGAIEINEYNQTANENIYAIGDVAGPPWLAHVASAQGYLAAEHSSGKNVIQIDYSNIPGCTYCQPQIGSIGMTEEEAIKLGHEVKIGRYQFHANGKSMAVGNTEGFVKLVFDSKYGELLGAHIIGQNATEMISELGVAKTLETTWDEIAMTMHGHPTLSEAIMEAALDALGKPIHQ